MGVAYTSTERYVEQHFPPSVSPLRSLGDGGSEWNFLGRTSAFSGKHAPRDVYGALVHSRGVAGEP